ncbi:Cytochrome c oxidase assembly protein cox15 [Agyrium rufum]|nr:Cytochrome c oxidase assembly protein cox15 [Agyrium rufum]
MNTLLPRHARLLTTFATRLSTPAFVCRQCERKISQSAKPLPRSHFLGAFRSANKRRALSTAEASTLSQDGFLSSSSPLSSLSRSIKSSSSSKSFFPELSERSVAYWLIGSAASVFGLVVFGGLTRLTESGLSITEWRPVTGSRPPMNDTDWQSEFLKYKSSPEFKLLNPNMTLSEFKSIYYMEWIHRQWGRLVGITFLVPAAYFIARRKVSAPMALKIGGIAGLIGFQGFLGWWMVKSGLKDDLFAPGSHPRVSQYRLTAHLGTAFICYTAMVWNGLQIFRDHKILINPVQAETLLAKLRLPELKVFRRSVAALAVLVFCTALSGGLVAGLDAGLIYNQFPYMGEGLTPPKSELFSDFYSHREDKSDLWWRNMLENPSLVQLDHRILATTTFTSIMALWAYSRFSTNVRTLLPRVAHRGVHGVVGFAFLQVTLGITTLLYLVPLPLASMHQAGALALLTTTMILGSRVWLPRMALRRMVERGLKVQKVPMRIRPTTVGLKEGSGGI